MIKPNKCHICGSTEFWQRLDGDWVCTSCHSNPVVGKLPQGQYSPEVLALRDRVRRGNDKLVEAWPKVLAMTAELERWDKAMKKLMDLCGELQKTYTDCLYIKDGRKTRKCIDERGFFCMVCSSDRKYWCEE